MYGAEFVDGLHKRPNIFRLLVNKGCVPPSIPLNDNGIGALRNQKTTISSQREASKDLVHVQVAMEAKQCPKLIPKPFP